MSDVTYDFEDVLGPEWSWTIDPPDAPVLNDVVVATLVEDFFGTRPSGDHIVAGAIQPHDADLRLRLSGITWAGQGHWEMESAHSGDAQDIFSVSFLTTDDVIQVINNSNTEQWGHIDGMVPAGTYTMEFRFHRGSTDPDFAGFGIDNLVLHDAVMANGGPGDPPAATPYLRDQLVKRLGGLYLCLVDNATTEPGPGDSAEWAELVPRSVT